MNQFTLKIKSFIFFCACAFILCGCNKDAAHYKEEADKEVYAIIDRQWNDEFGPKSNYKITDMPQSPNDVLADVNIPSGVLTLASSVVIAIEHNRQYQTQKENLYIRALDLTLIKHAYKPNPFGKISIGYSKDSSGELVNSGIGFEKNDPRYRYTRKTAGFARDFSSHYYKRVTVPIPMNYRDTFKEMVRDETKQLLETRTQMDKFNEVDAEKFAMDLLNKLKIKPSDFKDQDAYNNFVADTTDDVIDHLSPNATEIDRSNDVEAITKEATFGFSQLLETGTQISTSVAFAWMDILSGDFRSGLTTLLSGAIKKPLLRASSRKIAMENLTQAQRNTLYQIRTFSRFRKDFVVSIINSYYSILLQLDRRDNARVYYRTLDELHTKMEIFVRNGRIPPHELEEIHQDRLQAWDTVTKEEKLYLQMLDDFKIAMSITPTHNFKLDRKELDILADKPLSQPSFTADQAIETAMARRLDLMNTADAVADAERKIIVSTDRLRTELNLVASGQTRAGLSRLTNNDSSLNVGLELDLPIDRKAERNQYRKTLIALERQKRNHAQASDNVKHAIRQAYRNLTNAAELYRLQQEGLKLASERFKSTTLLIQYNRVNTRDILDAQKDLYKAKNDASAALVSYTVETLNFYQDTGVLEVNPDGMLQAKIAIKKPIAKKTSPNQNSQEVISNWLKNRKSASTTAIVK